MFLVNLMSSGSGRSVKVFWYVKQTMSWDDAEESCRKMGGDLASIMTQEEQTAFDAAVEAAGAKDRHIWIGLRRNDHTHPWAWSSGQLQMASAGDEEQNCAVLQDSQRWTPHNCLHTHTHICYSDDIPSCNSTSCRQGDLLFVGVSRPWLRALEDCEQRGLRLLHILDAATQRRLTQLLLSLPPPHGPVRTAWVGLVHCFLRPLEAWEWVDGPVGYTRWHAHFPRWRFSYHCGQVVQEPPGDYSWWDACCGEEHPYICQEVTSGSRGATTPAEGAGEPCFQRVL